MASRDPRADIVDKDPFPQPKIRRIHSSETSSGSSMFTIEDLQNMFSGKQATPQPTGNKKIWEFSDIEKQHLGLATAAFTLALGFMAVRGLRGISELGLDAWIITLLLAMPVMLLAVGPAFIFHEFGHKLVAKKYGCWAEFRADPKGLRFGIMLSFFIGVVFMAPGAVMVSGLTKRRYNGHIAVAGPLTNLSLFIIGIPIWVFILGITGAFNSDYSSLFDGKLESVYLDGNSIVWQSMLIDSAKVWLYGNLFFGLFNMIPWGPLDGAKVKDWNEQVFYVVFLVFLIPLLSMFLGFWSPTTLLEWLVNKLF